MPYKRVNGMPLFFYKGDEINTGLKKSYFKYLRFKLADWISGGMLSDTTEWYNQLLELLAVLTRRVLKERYDSQRK